MGAAAAEKASKRSASELRWSSSERERATGGAAVSTTMALQLRKSSRDSGGGELQVEQQR